MYDKKDSAMPDYIEFETFFVELTCEIIEERGLTHSEFGRNVFGENDGPRIWRSVRNATGNKSRRKLSLQEAYMISDTLNKNLFLTAWQNTQQQRAEKSQHPSLQQ